MHVFGREYREDTWVLGIVLGTPLLPTFYFLLSLLFTLYSRIRDFLTLEKWILNI